MVDAASLRDGERFDECSPLVEIPIPVAQPRFVHFTSAFFRLTLLYDIHHRIGSSRDYLFSRFQNLSVRA